MTDDRARLAGALDIVTDGQGAGTLRRLAYPLYVAVILLATYGFTVAQAGVANLQDLNDFLALEMRMLLVFGAAFLLPVVIVMLNLLGVLKSHALRKARTFAIFGCFIFGAVATPSGDPFSMLALSVPMVIMYLISEIICRRNDRRVLKNKIREGLLTPEEAEAEYWGRTDSDDD